jgi:hypothetical protein
MNRNNELIPRADGGPQASFADSCRPSHYLAAAQLRRVQCSSVAGVSWRRPPPTTRLREVLTVPGTYGRRERSAIFRKRYPPNDRAGGNLWAQRLEGEPETDGTHAHSRDRPVASMSRTVVTRTLASGPKLVDARYETTARGGWTNGRRRDRSYTDDAVSRPAGRPAPRPRALSHAADGRAGERSRSTSPSAELGQLFAVSKQARFQVLDALTPPRHVPASEPAAPACSPSRS